MTEHAILVDRNQYIVVFLHDQIHPSWLKNVRRSLSLRLKLSVQLQVNR